MNYVEISGKYILIPFFKLLLSVCFSTLISIERELHTHPGGVCTHVLVGLGSCLFSMVSIYLRDKYPSPNADPARIAAQIVSGMGFLGSATIYKSENYVKGINTAANLWISAAVSMAIGCDLWELAMVTSIFTVIILFLNNRYKKYRYGSKKKKDKYNKNIELTNIKCIKRFKSIGIQLDHDPLDAPYCTDEDEDEYDNDIECV